MQTQQREARVGVEPETVLLWGYSVSHSSTASPQNHGDVQYVVGKKWEEQYLNVMTRRAAVFKA